MAVKKKKNEAQKAPLERILRGEKLNYNSVAKEISKPPFFGS